MDIVVANVAFGLQSRGCTDHATAEIVAIDKCLSWVEPLRPCDVICCFSEYPRYRNKLYPPYKAKRPSESPPMLDFVRHVLKESFDWTSLPALEADDTLGILATEGQFALPIIVSTDKDLRQIPGLLFNPVKRTMLDISADEAERFFAMQWVMGDSTDNYLGCRGIGPKKASQRLHDAFDPVDEAYQIYLEEGYDHEYAILMGRMARILRDSEWNRDEQEPILWDLSPAARYMEQQSKSDSTCPRQA